jgi:hypothetical protein
MCRDEPRKEMNVGASRRPKFRVAGGGGDECWQKPTRPGAKQMARLMLFHPGSRFDQIRKYEIRQLSVREMKCDK